MLRSRAASGACALLVAATLPAGCGAPDDAGPEAATRNEQRALAEAAEMLDDRPAPAAQPAASPSPAVAATAK